MSKGAAYLQEHILGEVTTNPAVLAALGHDMSVLEITPEMAVYPRVTNDIRKIARFTWQLAEKGPPPRPKNRLFPRSSKPFGAGNAVASFHVSSASVNTKSAIRPLRPIAQD